MNDNQPVGSKLAASAAIKIALTSDREEERQMINQDLALGIQAAAVDFGGEFISSVSKMVERAVAVAIELYDRIPRRPWPSSTVTLRPLSIVARPPTNPETIVSLRASDTDQSKTGSPAVMPYSFASITCR